MDIHDVRRQRLRLLAHRYNNDAELARAIEIDPSQLSRLIGHNPTRRLGHTLARRIEAQLGLPSGWLDSLDATSLDLSDKFAALPEAQQTLIGKLLNRPINDTAANALSTLIDQL